jgi:hypothetical protein
MIARKLQCSKFAVQRFLRKNGLTPPADIIEQFRIKAMTGRTSFTKAEDKKIKEEYLLKSVKSLAAEMDRSYMGIMGRIKSLKLELPQSLRDERKQKYMFRKGQVPMTKGKTWNEFMPEESQEKSRKTQFKPGNIPSNHRELGSMRITKDGYMEIKVAEPNVWEAYHRLMWEETFGPIPEGGVVRFVTSDRMNVHPFNLELITRGQHMQKNTIHNYGPEIAKAVQMVGALNRQINKLQNEKY